MNVGLFDKLAGLPQAKSEPHKPQNADCDYAVLLGDKKSYYCLKWRPNSNANFCDAMKNYILQHGARALQPELLGSSQYVRCPKYPQPESRNNP
jgi:hypothetical protein